MNKVKQYLNKNKMKHEGDILNYCFACEKGFSTYSNLNKHFQSIIHNKVKEVVE